jgi:predicted dehydrogenase
MTNVRVGVLGAGDVAQHTYLPGITRLAREGYLALAAVCDAIEERVAKAATTYAIPHAFTSYDAMLGSGEIDAVVNLTPMQVHAEATLKAFAAGKHVYTEKPVATTLADADRVIAAARQAGLVLACAPALMTHPESQEIRQLIAQGAIGKVCYVRARGSHPGPAWLLDYPSDPTWFYQPGAGPIFDLGVYPLTYVTGLLGPARRVVALSGIAIPRREVRAGVAKGKAIDVGIDDNTAITLDFGGACFAHVDASFCVLSSLGPRAEIYGSKGVISLAATADEPPYQIFRDEPDHELRGWLTPERVYRGRLMTPRRGRDVEERPWTFANGVAHFVNVIEGKEKLIMTPEHARHVLEIMLTSYESARSGRALELTTTFERGD